MNSSYDVLFPVKIKSYNNDFLFMIAGEFLTLVRGYIFINSMPPLSFLLGALLRKLVIPHFHRQAQPQWMAVQRPFVYTYSTCYTALKTVGIIKINLDAENQKVR